MALYDGYAKKRPPSALSKLPRYADKSNEQLVAMGQAGDKEALSVLVEKNQGAVYSHARRQAHKCTSLTIEDLQSEGSMGVVRAARDYDPTIGANFCTYATGWIRCYVTRAADRDSTVLSVSGRVRVSQTVPKYARMVESLTSQGFGHGEAHEVAQSSLGLSDFVVGAVRGFSSAKHPRSMDAALSLTDETDRTLHDVLPDERTLPLDEERFDDRGVLSRVMVLRMDFGERERAVLDERILSDGATLDEIAVRFGVTRERVRQIEERLKGKLKRVLSRPVVTRHAVERARVPKGQRPLPPPPESGRRVSAEPRSTSTETRRRKNYRMRCPALGGLGKPCGACVVDGDLCTLHSMRRARGVVVKVASE
jgi:RNA polymerase sigma factor (sigma-70 family)